MSVSSWLLFSALPVLAVYFCLFSRTFALISESEQRRFIEEAGVPAWRGTAIPLVGFLAIFLIPSFLLALPIAIFVVADTARATWRQHRKLRELGFDPRFEQRLLRISALSGVGISLLLLSALTR